MPRESFEELLTPANDDSPSSEACAAATFAACDEMVYDGKNMESIVEMLSFLNARLDVVSHMLLLLLVVRRNSYGNSVVNLLATATGTMTSLQSIWYCGGSRWPDAQKTR